MNVQQLLRAKGNVPAIIGPDDSIAALARLLAERKKGLALVCAPDGKLLGVVSVIDINRAVAELAERAPAMAVRTIMTTDFCACGQEDSAEDVLAAMRERRIRHLPVVDDGKLVGLLNMQGVLEHCFDEADMQVEEMRGYIFGVGYH